MMWIIVAALAVGLTLAIILDARETRKKRAHTCGTCRDHSSNADTKFACTKNSSTCFSQKSLAVTVYQSSRSCRFWRRAR